MTTSTPRPRALGRRWLRPLLLAVCAAAVLLVGSTSPAAADPLDLCADAPAPISPRSGLSALLGAQPAQLPDPTVDPFTDQSVHLADVYGFSRAWANSDLGCGADFLRDPVAVTNTQMANLTAGIISGFTMLLDSAERVATKAGIDWAQQIVGEVAGSLSGLLLGGNGSVGWLPLAVVALGVLIAWRARANYAATMRALVVTAAAVVLSVFALQFPAVASQTVDKGVQTVAAVAGGSFRSSIADTVNREAGYRTWLAGYFGDPDSDLATKLGPKLMAATHYTWAETAQIDKDPNTRTGIDKAKAEQFKAVAKEVEAASPSAYESFTGRADRVEPAITGVVMTVCAGLFALAAFALVLIGRIMMQGLLIAAPVAAVLGILPPGHVVLQKLWGLFTAALVAIAKFTIAAGVMTLVLGGLVSADMAGAERLLWIVVATTVGIILTRPARTVKTMIPGLDPNRRYLRELVAHVGTGVAVAAGVNAATPDSPAGEQPGTAPGTPRPGAPTAAAQTPTPHQEPLAPLPAPGWQQIPTEQAAGPTAEPVHLGRPAVLSGPVLDPDTGHTAARPVGSIRALEPGPGSTAPLTEPVAGAVPADQAAPGLPFVVHPSGVVLPPDPTLYRSGTPPRDAVRAPEPEALDDPQAVVLYRSGRA